MTAVAHGDRPFLVALAGPNGAGKTTFFDAHLARAGLRFVNADRLAAELDLDAYAAARVADSLRRELVRRRESFVFETVFSDPAGEKLSFLNAAAADGYSVILIFIGTSDPEICQQRVAMRVSQGGHDVPDATIRARFPRVLANLEAATRELDDVRIFDNDDLRRPFRRVAEFHNSRCIYRSRKLPAWVLPLLP